MQRKTIVAIAEAVGYSVTFDSEGNRVTLEKPTEGKRQARLTAAQKERILKAVMRAVREELERV